MDLALRVAALEALVESQAGRIAELESLLTADFEPPIEWRLHRREAQIFGALVARPRVTKEALFRLFYDEDAESATVIESHVSRLRRKLRRFGVLIESERYLGYRLVDREQFRRAA